MDEKDLLTIQQAAKMLGVERSAVYTAIYENRLPYQEVLGHKVITRTDAEAYKERTRVSGEKPKGRPKGSANRKRQAGGEAEAEAHD